MAHRLSPTNREQGLREAMEFENPDRRLWVKAGDVLPYVDRDDSTEVYFLEGTPIRGWVLAWRDVVVGLNFEGKLIARFSERTFFKRRQRDRVQ